MNLKDSKYKNFVLVKEMLQTGDIIKNLDIDKITSYAKYVKTKKAFFAGEGSSRIFPAKNVIYKSKIHNYKEECSTENSTQSMEYDLKDNTVFAASNSGKTKEVIMLIRKLKKKGHKAIIGVVANDKTPVMEESNYSYLL